MNLELGTLNSQVKTPEFLIWALEHSCSVRGFQDGRDTERTERQLRAAREVSEARREGRIFEGICVRPPNGFRISETLSVYGGLTAVEDTCRQCAVNALRERNLQSLAGCYGVVVAPSEQQAFYCAIETAIRMQLGDLPDCFVPASPAWYGLWMSSPLEAPRAGTLAVILRAAQAAVSSAVQGFDEFLIALELSQARQIPLHVAVYPRGHVESGNWLLDPHCPRCKAAWTREAARKCQTCDYSGPPASARKRKARGQRPYVPLAHLFGKQQAAEFLVRYEAFRARSRLPDRA